MNKVKIFDHDGFYIMQIGRTNFYLRWLEGLPNKLTTLEDYNNWQKTCLDNCVCLSDKYPPQGFAVSEIQEFLAINKLAEEVQTELKIDLNDYVIPFIGGINHFDWRELIKRFYNVPKDMSIYTYGTCYKDYLKEVIEKNQKLVINRG